MKVYVASRYEDAPRMNEWRVFLERQGWTVTSRWINGSHDLRVDARHDEERTRFAMEGIEDLLSADVMVLHNPRSFHRTGRGGRHVETGIAIIQGIPVVLVGERENVFHWHAGVHVVPDIGAAIEMLCGLPQ